MYSRDGRLVFQRASSADGYKQHAFQYLGGQLAVVADYDSGSAFIGVRYPHTDGQGTIVAYTNASRQVLSRSVYDSWGGPRDHANDDAPGYTGHMQDSLIGLTYMQQRYYDPALARFISVDPVGVDPVTGANFNRYWYANDNPYRYTDPFGLCSGSSTDSKSCDPDNTDNSQSQEPPPPQQQPITLPTITVTAPAPATQSGDAQLAQVDPIVDPEEFLRFVLPKVGEIPKPDFDYPADPAKPPAPGFKWEGRGPPGSRRGNWYDPKTRQSLHPDLKHGKPTGPHWDWKAPNGKWYRWYPDGRIEPKFNPDFASL